MRRTSLSARPTPRRRSLGSLGSSGGQERKHRVSKVSATLCSALVTGIHTGYSYSWGDRTVPSERAVSRILLQVLLKGRPRHCRRARPRAAEADRSPAAGLGITLCKSIGLLQMELTLRPQKCQFQKQGKIMNRL